MRNIRTFDYSFSIKTTDAELKAYKNLTNEVRSGAFCLFELTKSRITSKNPYGTIFRRIDQLRELCDGKEFGLDLTTHSDLQNIEIEDLLDETDGFKQWRNFLLEIGIPGLAPTLQFVEGCTAENVARQARKLESAFGRICIRVDAYMSADEILQYVLPAVQAIDSEENVFFYLDFGFLRPNGENAAIIDAAPALNFISQRSSENIFSLASSFPRSVTESGYGRDSEGCFPLTEVHLSRVLAERISHIKHGDYGSVHPVRYTGGGIAVPRVDVPLDEECYYYRFRRVDGGYAEAARRALKDRRYESLSTWGDHQIHAAAQGHPEANNPSHWIAVRVNIHVTRQYRRLDSGRGLIR